MCKNDTCSVPFVTCKVLNDRGDVDEENLKKYSGLSVTCELSYDRGLNVDNDIELRYRCC